MLKSAWYGGLCREPRGEEGLASGSLRGTRVCQSVSSHDTLTLVLLRATRDLAGGGGCACLQLRKKASVMTERGGTEKNFIQ